MPRKIKIIIFSVIALLVALVAVTSLLKDVEKKRVAQEQKHMLSQSLKNVEQVYYEFAESMPYAKDYKERPSNLCSRVGAVNITEYGCGNRSSLSLQGIEESDYRTINDQFNNIYLSNDAFKDVKIEQPIEVSYVKGMGGSINSIHKNTGTKCYASSLYERSTKVATFDIGCSEVVKEAIFPLSD